MLKSFKGIFLIAILSLSKCTELKYQTQTNVQLTSRDVNDDLNFLAGKFCLKGYNDSNEKLSFRQEKVHEVSPIKTKAYKSSLALTSLETKSIDNKVFVMNFLIGFFDLNLANTDDFDQCVKEVTQADGFEVNYDVATLQENNDFVIILEYCQEFVCFQEDYNEPSNMNSETPQKIWFNELVGRIQVLGNENGFSDYFTQILGKDYSKKFQAHNPQYEISGYEFLREYCSAALMFDESEEEIQEKKTGFFKKVGNYILGFFKEMRKYIAVGWGCYKKVFKSLTLGNKIKNILDNVSNMVIGAVEKIPIVGTILKIFKLIWQLLSAGIEMFNDLKNKYFSAVKDKEKVKTKTTSVQYARKIGSAIRSVIGIFLPTKKANMKKNLFQKKKKVRRIHKLRK